MNICQFKDSNRDKDIFCEGAECPLWYGHILFGTHDGKHGVCANTPVIEEATKIYQQATKQTP